MAIDRPKLYTARHGKIYIRWQKPHSGRVVKPLFSTRFADLFLAKWKDGQSAVALYFRNPKHMTSFVMEIMLWRFDRQRKTWSIIDRLRVVRMWCVRVGHPIGTSPSLGLRILAVGVAEKLRLRWRLLIIYERLNAGLGTAAFISQYNSHYGVPSCSA